MESLAALGVASNIIQIVDFSSRIISRGHELYTSTDGQATGHVVLGSATSNLHTLLEVLNKSKAQRDPKDLTDADRQLVDLQTRTKSVVDELEGYLQEIQVSTSHRKIASIYQALKSFSTDKDITRMANELSEIRKQVDTVLLVSMR